MNILKLDTSLFSTVYIHMCDVELAERKEYDKTEEEKQTSHVEAQGRLDPQTLIFNVLEISIWSNWI